MENLEPSKTPTKNKIKLDFKDSKYATGRRKRSIAKVWIKRGSGNIYVNGLKMAVKRMLPGGVLGRKQLTKLKIYAGNEHPHSAQNPTVI